MGWFQARAVVTACVMAATVGAAHAATSFTESFDNVVALSSAGWLNSSSGTTTPVSPFGFAQGNALDFPARSGAPTSYASTGFSFNNDLISPKGNVLTLLATPRLDFSRMVDVTFYTRGIAGNTFPDRLYVYSYAETAGTLTELTAINPNLAVGGYPEVWTAFRLTAPAIGGDGIGRIAFFYDVTDVSVNGNVIGIDDLSIQTVPEPASAAIVLAALLASGAATRVRARRG